MGTIQALNAKKSNHQRGHRVMVWAGTENTPGHRANWVIYGGSVAAAVGKAIRTFRRDVAPNARLTDWMVNVEPLRADETIVPAEKP
jgi:hypothetical protein